MRSQDPRYYPDFVGEREEPEELGGEVDNYSLECPVKKPLLQGFRGLALHIESLLIGFLFEYFILMIGSPIVDRTSIDIEAEPINQRPFCLHSQYVIVQDLGLPLVLEVG